MSWDKIKTFFKENAVTIIMSIVILVLVICLGRSCTNNKNNQKMSDANIAALMDTVDCYKCKNGELAAEKLMLVGDMDLLEQTNKELSDELKNMKVKNASLAAKLCLAIKNVQHDTCWKIEFRNDTAIVMKGFNFDDLPYRKLSGNIAYNNEFMRMKIDSDMVYADLDLAVEDNVIKVHSNNPYLTFNEIYGVNVPEYEPTWCLVVGPSISAGYGYGTNFNNGNCPGGLVVSAGVSLTFGWNIVGVGKRVKKIRK